MVDDIISVTELLHSNLCVKPHVYVRESTDKFVEEENEAHLYFAV